jgi:hypothetical protein
MTFFRGAVAGRNQPPVRGGNQTTTIRAAQPGRSAKLGCRETPGDKKGDLIQLALILKQNELILE